ncbi:uncharacterized protein LOC135839585 isoform X1 [Planococcus citri]|uniref:uncharacterized protein LOC135839585 isoform X1 n=1 Tax=Planococcus citri TaxID=170843 RepID=UPI0031F7E2CB
MNTDKFFVVLHIFILFVTASTISCESVKSDDYTSTNSKKPEEDLSENSLNFYNALPDDKMKKQYVDQYTKNRDQLNKIQAEICARKANQEKIENEKKYSGFLCATDLLPSQLVNLYPRFKGQWKKVEGKLTNPNYVNFMKNFHSSYRYQTDLIQKQYRFEPLERNYSVSERSRAKVKMPNFFKTMCALLTRYADPMYKDYITEESSKNAEDITKLVIFLDTLPNIKNAMIESFSAQYAFIRQCFNIFSHYPIMLRIDEAMTELENREINRRRHRLMNLQLNLTDGISAEAPVPINVHLCDVLDYMGILQLWGFTDNDLKFMNIVSEVIRSDKKGIYTPFYCDRTDANGKTTTVVLPVTDYRNCPVG